MISMIYARDENYGVGFKNKLPWPRNSKDMKTFFEITHGHTVIMGSSTFESLGKKPLVGRHNLVLTSDQSKYSGVPATENLEFISGPVSTLMAIVRHMTQTLHVIGGPTIYRQFLPYCDEIHETIIDGSYESDTYIDKNTTDNFKEVYSKIEDTHIYRKLIRCKNT